MLIGKQGAVKPLFLMTLCCHLNTLLSFAVFAVENLARQYLRKNGMTEINEMNADKLYHLFSTYLSGLPRSVVLSLGEVS